MNWPSPTVRMRVRIPTCWAHASTILHGGWTARVAVGRCSYDTDAGVPELVGGLRTTGFPQALAVADDLDQRPSGRAACSSASPTTTVRCWRSCCMAGSIPIRSSVPTSRKLYGFAGYRLRQWTPFASFSSSRDRAALRRRACRTFRARAAQCRGARHAVAASLHAAHHLAGRALRPLLARRPQVPGGSHEAHRYVARP